VQTDWKIKTAGNYIAHPQKITDFDSSLGSESVIFGWRIGYKWLLHNKHQNLCLAFDLWLYLSEIWYYNKLAYAINYNWLRIIFFRLLRRIQIM